MSKLPDSTYVNVHVHSGEFGILDLPNSVAIRVNGEQVTIFLSEPRHAVELSKAALEAAALLFEREDESEA